MRGRIFTIAVLVFIFFVGSVLKAQISPGPLAAVHSHLEGMSNCTQCHELGNKVTNAKCLACHTELKGRIDQNKGYHVSSAVKGKNCIGCHSDHHGVTFQILRFDKTNFDHRQTGFALVGAHAKKTCNDCHKPELIADKSVKKKKFTYLGLNTACLSCHVDYHQQTLSTVCTNCHSQDAFKPAVKFNHANTKFPLVGMHQAVECVKCHRITEKNGASFQEFAGKKFDNCTNCHQDPHQNRFGQNCRQCHSEASFHTVKGISNFDHSKTNFPLLDKHQFVPCSSCHKGNLTDKIKHDRCTDCHKDYHNGQFTKQGIVQDCSSCHTTKGYDQFSFTIEQHNAGTFKLEGAHLATPCFSCHKKTEKWSFRNVGSKCVDCHENIHGNHISQKYYPESNCTVCHNSTTWMNVKFDHSVTGFALTGVHASKECQACHFPADSAGHAVQKFSELSTSCESCHKDEHFAQFNVSGVTDCSRCHNSEHWKIESFDHNRTAFKLDGKHQGVPCNKCHKPVSDGKNTYVLYKIKEWKCENCH